ncbi:MAG: helix-hairpin-helix domain-containing protein [Thermodesulfovibrionia bacterium]
MEKETKEKGVIEKVEKERAEFKKLIIQNPNYFGTFPEVKIKPVLSMKANTKYEELRCIGFYPESDLLEAIIDVKLPYGYKGNLCSQGSFEYVRFFVDWDGDGDFTDADEDVGIVSVNVHDIPDGDKVCLDKTKPLSYALTLKIDSKKYVCDKPYLVKVRAILSWDVPPLAGNPNYIPVWGNVVDGWIQIKPAKFFLKDIIKVADLKKLNLEPAMLDLDIPISKTKALTPVELEEIYKGKDVPEHRFNFTEIKNIAESVKLDPNLMVKYKLDPKFSKIIENIDVILAEKPNTKYEELHCVGLNYDLDTLVATLTVKLPYGYSGNLCTKGSYEYVGFWAYIWDQIEQMCYWKYLGTSSVNVHDINNIPPEGLQYAVYLPVDLSSYRDKCTKPKIMKIRAILSWQTPPPNNNPNYNPVWGNKVDALIQIKPGEPIEPGEQIPYIWAVGEMAVESISGNPYTVIPSALGDGYANGVSVSGGFTAIESPFGGVIAISGTITNAPNNPVEADKLRYKVQYKKSGEVNWHDITNTFKIWIRIDGVPSGFIDQIADADGYFKYQKDLTPPVITEVQNDILAQWHTPVSEGDGLYEIRVLLYKPGAPPAPGVPADHISSNTVRVMVDNTPPKAEISLKLGACTKYTVGDTIEGKFTATDTHIWKYNISVEPSVASPPTIDKPGEVYPALPAPGRVDEHFTLTTTALTTPCGYVLHLYVWDRTIVNNYMQGNQNGATVGLCLLEKK